MVSSLLKPYITEDILTDAAVYVEADLEKGIVYAAGYSRKADRFLPEERGVVAVFYGILENGERVHGREAGTDFGYYGESGALEKDGSRKP